MKGLRSITRHQGAVGGFLPLLTTLLAGWTCWQVFRFAAPTPPEYTVRQWAMARELAEKAGDWVSDLELGPGRAIFGNLARDEFGAVSGQIRLAVWRSDRFTLLDRDLEEKIRERIGWSLPADASVRESAQHARSRGARFAIGGEVLRFVDLPHERILHARLYIWDTTARAVVAEKKLEINHNPAAANSVVRVVGAFSRVGGPITYRLCVWVMTTGLLPFVLLLWRKHWVADAENGTILLMLLGLTMASSWAGFLLVYSATDPFWGGLLLLLLILGGAGYHFGCLSWMRRWSAQP